MGLARRLAHTFLLSLRRRQAGMQTSFVPNDPFQGSTVPSDSKTACLITTSPADQASWNNGKAGLKAHEEGHAQINRDAAQKLDKALPEISGTGGAPTSGEAYKKAVKHLTQKLNQKVRSVSTERNT